MSLSASIDGYYLLSFWLVSDSNDIILYYKRIKYAKTNNLKKKCHYCQTNEQFILSIEHRIAVRFWSSTILVFAKIFFSFCPYCFIFVILFLQFSLQYRSVEHFLFFFNISIIKPLFLNCFYYDGRYVWTLKRIWKKFTNMVSIWNESFEWTPLLWL